MERSGGHFPTLLERVRPALHKNKRFTTWLRTASSNSRKEATRTPDPYVPNVVRYQLRYFPISGISVEIPVGLYPF